MSLRYQAFHQKIYIIGIELGLHNPHEANYLSWIPLLHEWKVSHIVIVFQEAVCLLWVIGQDQV